MHSAVHKKIKLGFYIAFTIMVGAAISSYLIAINLTNNAIRLNRSIEISKRLEVIHAELKEAQAAIACFSITRDSNFLHPSLQERITGIENQYRQLHHLTAKDTAQQHHLDTLKDLLYTKYTQLLLNTRTDTLKGKSQVNYLINKDSGRIESKIRDMEYRENQQLAEKSALFNFFSSLWLPVIFVTSLLAIIICVYAFVLLNKEYRLQLHIDDRLKQYQHELQQHITLLATSNQELEQFAYVASHDLQEPLRKIATFSDRLQGKYGPLLPTDGLELLGRMHSAVSRMRILINDLLAFSRAGRLSPANFSQVDFNQILQEVKSDLELAIQEKNVSIHCDHLPTLSGQATALHQLFFNLLSNAIKFAAPNRPLAVNITCKIVRGRDLQNLMKNLSPQEDYYSISVEDNGIGFEQEYAERIFLLFQRLHGVSEYAGTGIGLAICKKIVEGHQGAIQAFGTLGEGARFEILLPLKQSVYA
ncbi:CHASE3 domain-containing protein [Chitinophaga costaii]|uniref:histidine kinase n=1 Tax=Chitinophaga costaii TaxID=1335309 RepID=A0A1C4FR02_9BACT|nr:ATP-binding protein [Chitinophaga costaii]PUZ20464.1 hypothetical protein DCM91_18695 [Chitinophaga costaii]SCC58234.1 CHASE3 domain-containing protein [Chitinophaga costaii]